MNKTKNRIDLKGSLLPGRGNSPFFPAKDFHFHNTNEIFLFLNGKVNFFVDQFSYPLQRGNVLVFNKRESHKFINVSTEPYERITIHFNPDMVQYFCTSETNLLSCFQNRRPGMNNIALLDESQISEFSKLAYPFIDSLNQKKFGSDVLPLTYLIQILIFINDIFQKTDTAIPTIISPVVQAVMQYIDENLQAALTLERLSKELAVDKFYLSRLFRQQTGVTIYRYILLKRVAHAKQLLASGSSVLDACIMSGFNDYANFIRTFKNISGISPGRYSKTR